MEIYKLLEEIESILKSAKTIPFSKQSLVDADNIIKLIGEVRVKLPEELKQAKWIKEERDRIKDLFEFKYEEDDKDRGEPSKFLHI